MTPCWTLRVLIAALLASIGSPGPIMPDTAAAQSDARCFPETNRCLSGRFRQYWEQNGGVAVFGFPVTAARPELNRDTGRVYLTQWFERNRFEWHPEHAPPYDVLLGRLGDDRLRQLGRAWQEEPRAAPQADCLYVEQTGRNVCDQDGGRGFKTYWTTHGLTDPGLDDYGRSLALFGLPLTEARLETNSSGDTVLTQWFERARFEWHPDKPAEFTVLLGLLGHEVGPPAVVGQVQPVNGACPETHPIKGNIASRSEKIYHVPGGASYNRVIPEACFSTEEDAQAAGYRRAQR